MAFHFPYTIKQAKDCINETERQLRDLISSVMASRYGPAWESTGAGWDTPTRQALEQRRTEEQAKFPHQSISDRLLDFSDIKDLKELAMRHWTQFGPIFGSKERTRVLFDELGKLRNPEMHSRPGILRHQQHLCLGICGEFLLAIHNWRQGHTHQVAEYEVSLRFPVAIDGDEATAQADAHAHAEQWVENVKQATGGTLEQKSATDSEQSWLLRLSSGHVHISMTWNYRGLGSDGQYFRAADIVIRSTNHAAVDRVLRAGKAPYWVLKWSLKDELDITAVATQVREQAGTGPISSVSVQVGDEATVLVNASYALGTVNGGRVRLDLARASSVARPSISLVYDGMPDQGFTSAHNQLSISEALRILYGELAQATAHQRLAGLL